MTPDPLPPPLRWEQGFIAGNASGTAWLYCGATVVASLSEHSAGGTWVTRVNRHVDFARERSARAPTLAKGRQWIERWAVANLERLCREATRGH